MTTVLDETGLSTLVDTIKAALDGDRDARALRRFRLTMRRLERRARRLGLRSVPEYLREVRIGLDSGGELPFLAAKERLPGRDRQAAWIYERAADATAKFRAETQRITDC